MSTILEKIVNVFSKPEVKEDIKSTSTVKDLKEYKSRLYSSLSRDLSEFEKNFLLISAGILAFSITFIKDIVKIDTADYLTMLFISWALIAVSIGIMMFTFIKSAYSSDKLWFLIDDFQADKDLYIDTAEIDTEDFIDIKKRTSIVFKKSKRALKHMRITAIILFLLGLALLGFFTGINIYAENHKAAVPQNNILINYNTKSRQLNINGVKLSVNDTTISIVK